METINNLTAIEFDLKEDADETAGNFYQGCSLTIVDDENGHSLLKTHYNLDSSTNGEPFMRR